MEHALFPVVPSLLQDDETLERHYSFLPQFQVPFVNSYLNAVKRQTRRATATLGRTANVNRILSHRLPLSDTSPRFVPFLNLLTVPTASTIPPFVVHDSLPASYSALGHLIGRELATAFDLSQRDASSDGLLAPWKTSESREMVDARVRCLRRNDVRASRAEEVYADVVGMKLALEALRLTGFYEASSPSGVVDQWTEEQLFYGNACFKWCSLGEIKVGQRSEAEARCNEPLRHDSGFFKAFNCGANAQMASHGKSCWN